MENIFVAKIGKGGEIVTFDETHFATLRLLSRLNESEMMCIKKMANAEKGIVEKETDWELTNLFYATLEIRNDEKNTFLPIFQKIEDREDSVAYEWSDVGQSILEHVKNVPDAFYLAQSVYTVYFYLIFEKMLISAKLEPCSAEFQLQALKEFCQCNDKYKKFSHFKDRIMDTALTELQKICNIKISYCYIYSGQHIQSIRFHIGE